MKLFYVLFLLALLLSSAFAVGGSSAPTAPILNAPLETSIERDGSFFTAETSVSADSATWFSLYSFKQGWQYVLETGVVTGTAASTDSVKMALRADLYNSSKTFMRSVTFDTLADHNGHAYVLPLYLTAFASYVTIKAVSYGAGNGTQKIFPAGYVTIWKRRPITYSKQWQ